MLLGILLAAIIVVCVALVGVILLQRSEGGVLGMSGGGGAGNFMSARGTGDLLTRATQILAATFFGLCLIMTLVTGHLRREASIASQLKNLSIAPPAASGQPPLQAAAPAPQPVAPLGAQPAQSAPAGSTSGLDLFGGAAPKSAAKPAKASSGQAASSTGPAGR
jgi:preprotein translocase subunit SecG